MTDVTIYKPPSVTVRLVNGKYVITLPPGMTISAVNVYPPVEFSIDPPLQVKPRGSVSLTGSISTKKQSGT